MITRRRAARRKRSPSRLARLLTAGPLGAALVWSVLFGPINPAAADREIYMFRDEKGVIHFTNAPADHRYRLFQIKARVSVGGGSSKIDPEMYRHFIQAAAMKYQLDPALIKAVIRVESAFNQNAVSWAGAQGLMQLMPGTASLMGVQNAFNPQENIFGGSGYLRRMLNRFNNDLDLALAAYNIGPERVAKDKKVPSVKETQAYVKQVKYYYTLYRKKT
ncbi:MAG: transglycosylase SLT domain-containing protein [Thermodesulfobacteriota bacterium]